MITYEKSDVYQYLNMVRLVTENNNNRFISIYSSFSQALGEKLAGWLNQVIYTNKGFSMTWNKSHFLDVSYLHVLGMSTV